MNRQQWTRQAQPEGRSLPVEVVVQHEAGCDRQVLRIAPGSSIREVLARAGQVAAISGIEAGQLGLSCHGSRAKLDDPLTSATRIEVMLPITADAKAWRRERVAARRANQRQGGWRTRGRANPPT